MIDKEILSPDQPRALRGDTHESQDPLDLLPSRHSCKRPPERLNSKRITTTTPFILISTLVCNQHFYAPLQDEVIASSWVLLILLTTGTKLQPRLTRSPHLSLQHHGCPSRHIVCPDPSHQVEYNPVVRCLLHHLDQALLTILKL